MPRTWSEGFDFYLIHLEDGPASIFVDLQAVSHAPVKSHPTRLLVRMKMKHAHPNGLRSSDEAQRLFDLEDAISDALAPHDPLFVGRVVTGGNSDLFFYLPAAVEKAALEPLIRSAAAEYPVSIALGADPEWSTYFEVLYPDLRDRELIANRHVCDNLKKNGDRHEVPRMVDHLAYFPDERSALSTGALLVEAGFSVAAPQAPSGEQGHQMWSLEFHRVDALADGRIDEVTLEILDLLEGTGGHYDGWGCVVVSASA